MPESNAGMGDGASLSSDSATEESLNREFLARGIRADDPYSLREMDYDRSLPSEPERNHTALVDYCPDLLRTAGLDFITQEEYQAVHTQLLSVEATGGACHPVTCDHSLPG